MEFANDLKKRKENYKVGEYFGDPSVTPKIEYGQKGLAKIRWLSHGIYNARDRVQSIDRFEMSSH